MLLFLLQVGFGPTGRWMPWGTFAAARGNTPSLRDNLHWKYLCTAILRRMMAQTSQLNVHQVNASLNYLSLTELDRFSQYHGWQIFANHWVLAYLVEVGGVMLLLSRQLRNDGMAAFLEIMLHTVLMPTILTLAVYVSLRLVVRCGVCDICIVGTWLPPRPLSRCMQSHSLFGWLPLKLPDLILGEDPLATEQVLPDSTHTATNLEAAGIHPVVWQAQCCALLTPQTLASAQRRQPFPE